MSTESATEYAQSILAGIIENVTNGTPYGDEPGEDGETATAWDYVSDALDIEYRVNAQGEYKSAELLVSFGGPNAWVDTARGELIVTWWSSPVRVDLPEEFVGGIDEVCRELWESR